MLTKIIKHLLESLLENPRLLFTQAICAVKHSLYLLFTLATAKYLIMYNASDVVYVQIFLISSSEPNPKKSTSLERPVVMKRKNQEKVSVRF